MVNHTINQVTTDENHVFAQALKFTAVFDKLQATQYHQNNDDVIFAIHCQYNSLFALTLCFVFVQTYFATDID
jgi:hypothetical protein